jgi:hypothetical protein
MRTCHRHHRRHQRRPRRRHGSSTAQPLGTVRGFPSSNRTGFPWAIRRTR